MDSALETLFAPLESGDVRPAGNGGGRALFLGARTHPALRDLDMDVWQPWKPYAAALPAAVLPDLPDGPYDRVFVLAPKQVAEAKHWIALALSRLASGGVLFVAAANDSNGARLEKWCAEAGLEPHTYTKNKARCVWGARPATLPPVLADWLTDGSVRTVDFGDGIKLKSKPGLFSWDRIDPGSRLLADHLPANLAGMAADFGAGIGFLSHAILRRPHALNDLYLVEADARALALSVENLENVRAAVRIHSRWADATKPLPDRPALDHILMNPPFHDGKKTDPAIGRKFIETAAHHLKKGGTLHLVANAHLPYEDVLRGLFANVQMIVQASGYKIIRAVK